MYFMAILLVAMVWAGSTVLKRNQKDPLMPSFAYSVTVVDKTGLATAQNIATAKAVVEAAFAEYAKYITGAGSIEIQVQISNSFGLSAFKNDLPQINGSTATIPSLPAAELISGIDQNGSTPDAFINFNIGAFNSYWTGDRAQVPADKVDAVSVVMGSLKNVFNVYTFSDATTGAQLTTPGGGRYSDPMNPLLQKIGGKFFFTGANAVAVFGGPVPLVENPNSAASIASLHPTLSSDVFANWDGNSQDALLPGKAYSLSPLDLAIIKDLNPGLKVTIPQKGTAAVDTFRPLLGIADIYDGLGARDTVVELSARSAYNVTQNSDGSVAVTLKSDANDVDTFTNVERIHFSDGVLIFDGGVNASPAYRLYQAAFARVPDEGGLLVQAHQAFDVLVPQKIAAGFSNTDKVAGFTVSSAQYQAEIDVAGRFITAPEFVAKYGTNVSDGAFVDLLYQNVLGRPPDAGGRQVQVDALQHGTSRATLLANFAESPENVALTAANTVVGLWSTFPDPAFA